MQKKKLKLRVTKQIKQKTFTQISFPLLEPVDTAQEQSSSQNMDLANNEALSGEKISQQITAVNCKLLNNI